MKGDNHAIQQDQDMVNEIDDDLALMKKLRKNEGGASEEDDEEGNFSKKEKSKGNFFLSDRGNQIRENLER